MKTTHPHKDIIDAWTADMTLEIEGSRSKETWYLTTIDEAIYNPSQTFRIKPKERCVTVDGTAYEFPEPMRVAPEQWSSLWFASPSRVYEYNYDKSDKWITDAVRAGFAHLTREAAEQHRAVLIAVNGGVE
jgi:hypothetical protein